MDAARDRVRRLESRIVVPMHYHISGITTVKSTLQLPEACLRSQDQVRHLGSHTVTSSPQVLPVLQEVWLLEPYLG